jgi:hypothetical protein
MTPQDAVAIASSIRRHLGEDAENYVRNNIAYFEAPPANLPAAVAWQDVLVALKELEERGEP